MKKTALSIIFALAVSFSAHAQLRIGATVGGEYVKPGYPYLEKSSGYGVTVGAVADYTFSASTPVFLRAQVNWTCTQTGRDLVFDTTAYSEDRTSRYLSVPVSLGYGLLGDKLRLSLGEEFAYAYSVDYQKEDLGTTPTGEHKDQNDSGSWEKGKYNRWSTSLFICAEYMALDWLGIYAKAQKSLPYRSGQEENLGLVQAGLTLYF